MSKRTTAIVVGALACALAVTGCSTSSSGTGGGSASASGSGSSFYNINEHPYSALKQGGTLNFAVDEFTPQKNAFNADGTITTTEVWSWYNPQVIGFKPNGDLNPNPNYVTSVTPTTVNGNTVVTYELNPKAKYNDGTPIDVTAFQNTWNANSGKNTDFNANSTDGYNRITSVAAGKDNTEVVVTFDGVNPWWGGLFNNLLNPACNTVDCFNNGYVGTDLASAHPEWGAGPYMLQSFDANAGTATLVPNPNWWGNPGKLDKITITQRESTATINAFVNGESDVVGAGTADYLKQVQAVPGTETRTGANTAVYMLQLNSTSAPLTDITVRQAIMTGIDRGQIDQVRFQGMNYTEQFPGSFLLFSFQTGYQDNFSQVIPKADPAAAKTLLEGDGYALGSDGYYAKDGAQLAISLTTFGDNANTKAMAQVVQQQLKNIGINMTIDNQPSTAFSTVMSQGAWQMNISGFAQTDPFGVAYTCQIYCSTSDPNYSGLNKSGTGTTELDAEIHQMETLATSDQQIQAANAIEVKALKLYGLMPLFNGPTVYQAKSGLANIGAGVFAGTQTPFGDFVENIGYVS